MRTRVLAALFAGLTVSLFVGGCSDSNAGNPAPGDQTASGETQQPGSGLPSHGAPKVEKPLDTSDFEAKPCSVATVQKLKSAGLDVEQPESDPDGSTGPECIWTFASPQYGSMAGAFVRLHNQGLSALYQRRSSYALFEPVSSVAGYPAVIYDTSDSRKDGFCALSVGVRDDQQYEIATTLDTAHPDQSNPCSVAQKVAEIAVETMKNGGS